MQPVDAEVISAHIWRSRVSWQGAETYEDLETIAPEGVAERNQAYAEIIVISGEETILPKCMGTFVKSGIKATSAQDWRPIYRNNRGMYLYYCDGRNVWLVSYSFTDKEGLLMSSCGAVFPEAASAWNVWDRYAWRPNCPVKVTTKGAGIWKPNVDGIQRGNWVSARTDDSKRDLFHEGERGRVVAMIHDRHCRVQFEGRNEAVPVATWLLHPLPESFSTDIKREVSFSLPLN